MTTSALPARPLPGPLPPLHSVTGRGRRPPPRLIVTGGVHGNETCGTTAIERVLDAIDRGALSIAAGTVTFVPVANPLARALGQRCGDRNLNRGLAPTAAPREFEDEVANWLCPLLGAHDALLDLHSFSAPEGRPFVMLGPPDNDGPLEPFAHAAEEEALARVLGVGRVVHGWMAAYAAGVARRRERLAARAAGSDAGSAPDGPIDLDWRHGIGTTEYLRSQGGWGLTLECGPHADPQAPVVAEAAIHRTLAHLRLVDAPTPAPAPVTALEVLRLDEVVDRLHPQDRWARDWRPFDRVAAGDLVAVRHDGTALRAPRNGRIVFPNAGAGVDDEWLFLAGASDRLGMSSSGDGASA